MPATPAEWRPTGPYRAGACLQLRKVLRSSPIYFFFHPAFSSLTQHRADKLAAIVAVRFASKIRHRCSTVATTLTHKLHFGSRYLAHPLTPSIEPRYS
jgi:hypothetical protein